MQSLMLMPTLFAAAEYSLIYMLFGGGFMGAIIIYFIARALGK